MPIIIFQTKMEFFFLGVKSTLIGKRAEILLPKQLNLGSNLT